MIFGLAPKSSTESAGGNAVAMAYIVTKQNRFYVVTYDGIDPNTGRERRRWHLAGDSREDAETIAANLTHRTDQVRAGACSAATVTSFVSEVWMPKRVQHLRPSTAHRYRWMIDNYITPTIGHLPIRSLRAEHLERLYADLLATGKINGTGLAPKTVYDVHVIMRAALKHAVQHPSRRTQRRARRHRSPPHSPSQARTRIMDVRPAQNLPRRHPTPAPVPGTTPRRHDRHATRRTRRPPLE